MRLETVKVANGDTYKIINKSDLTDDMTIYGEKKQQKKKAKAQSKKA